MFDEAARIERLTVPEGRRILVVSDIHGNLPYFKGVLARAGFSDRDELIVDGDFLEKGADSLGTLRFLMELCRRGNTHALLGNCDGWSDIFRSDARDEQLLQYVLWRKSGLLWDMLNAAGLDPFEFESFADCKRQLFERFQEEWAFLARLPHAIETPHYIFAHAAVIPGKRLREHTQDELTRCDAFMRLPHRFDKWVIVGHYPVVLYGGDHVCANPVIDRESRVVSIDGGCVLKDDGQLNALIIPFEGSEDFCHVAYDSFPVLTVREAQEPSARSYYIRWGDNRVQVLRRGEEFSLCRHVRTGYEMEILSKYLFTDDTYTDCNDCTDDVLALRPGDRVSVVETTSRGYFVKHEGRSGWYFGALS